MSVDPFGSEALRRNLETFAGRVKAAQSEGRCVICEQPALDRIYSDAGDREYAISGTCERCFDDMFAEPPEHYDNDGEHYEKTDD